MRGLYTASGSRVFAAAGRTFYEMFPNQTALPRGDLITTAGIVNWADDGQQVVAVDGQKGYLLTLAAGSSFAVITDPTGNPPLTSPTSTVSWYLMSLVRAVSFGAKFWTLEPGCARLCLSRSAA